MKIELCELHDRYSLPPISGVYFIFASERLIYIGKARVICNRLTISRLMREFLKFGITHIYIFPIDEEKLTETENQLIKMFDPPLNHIGITRSKGRWKSLFNKKEQRKCFQDAFRYQRPVMFMHE